MPFFLRIVAPLPVDELIDVVGRAAIEAVLTLSAQEPAGPKHPGKKADGVLVKNQHVRWVLPVDPRLPHHWVDR